MNIKQIKNKMLKWRDYYGQDIPDYEKINNAKNKKELKEILYDHGNFLADQYTESLYYLNDFIKSLGL